MERAITMKIRLIEKNDLVQTAAVHQQVFTRQTRSLAWLTCNVNAFPRFLVFVAETQGEIQGYIIWHQKSGFRSEAVIELDQLAVLQKQQGQGIGSQLISDSLPLVKAQLALAGASVKHILVSTRADNAAQSLYKRTLNVEVEATFSDLYSDDEVLMIARHVNR